MLNTPLLIDLLLLGIVLWLSHVAGASYIIARTDETYRIRAMACSGTALFAALAIILRQSVSG
jgi:hypothetical protein